MQHFCNSVWKNELQVLSKRDKKAEEAGNHRMKQSLLLVSLALEFRCTWAGLSSPLSSEATDSEEVNPLKENKEDVFTF